MVTYTASISTTEFYYSILLLLFTARANTEVLLRTVERFVCVFLSVYLVSPLLVARSFMA